MLKRKLAVIILAVAVSNLGSKPITILANELQNATEITSEKTEIGGVVQATVNKFELYGSDKLEEYNKVFKIDNSRIKNITNNGGKYGSDIIDKSIDGKFSTHWETGKPNDSKFSNEVIIELDEVTELNRIIYAARQDGANGKGFAKKFEIYGISSDSEEDYKLVSNGSYSGSTGDIVEIKFSPTKFKKIKFKFIEANSNWASASEFMLYKEDSVSEKMSRLFTDSTMTAVNEEFNTVEKINALEEEVKTHPLYENFKEELSNAKSILESKDVVYSDAKVSSFIDINSSLMPKYNEIYKLDSSKITSITSNGGHYGAGEIKKAIDGDVNTYWHSGKQNTSNFTNEVVMTLDELTTLNRIIYTNNRGRDRGFAEAFDIYTSKTSKGDNFELVSSGKAVRTQDSIEIRFNPTEFRRVKFVFKKGYENWAIAAEFGLYKQDILSEKIDSVFTDGTMTTLSDEYKTEEAGKKLINEINNHPLAEEYKDIVRLVNELIENPNKFENENIVTASQRGEQSQESSKRGLQSATYSLDTFGRYVVPGESINVYVDADKKGVMPELILGQIANDIDGWNRVYKLKPGLNVITAPKSGTITPAAIYISNPALPKDQEYAPRVRVDGGTPYPVYYHGKTDPKEFRKELEEYNKKVSIDDKDFNNGVRDDVFYNITELTSENIVIATSAKGALKGLQEIDVYGEDVSKTMKDWEIMYEDFQIYSGFDVNAEEERFTPYPAKLNSRVFAKGPHAWAAGGYVGYNGGAGAARDDGFFKGIVKPFNRSDNWANTHEWGHKFNNNKMVDGEVTNNLYAQRVRRTMGLEGDRVPWDRLFTRFSDEKVVMGYFERLGVLTQIEAYFGEDTYGKASNYAMKYGDIIFKGLDGKDREKSQNRLIVGLSFSVGYDLTDFFEEWDYCNVLDVTRERVSSLPKLEANIKYIDSSVYEYKGDGFVSEEKPKITGIKKDTKNKTNTLSFNVDNSNKEHLLGYEVYRDGELVGYTRKDTFVDGNVDLSKNYSYKIVAFDKKLGTNESGELKTFKPTLSVEENVTLKLNSEYNPIDYVKAVSHNGEDISEKVIIKSNNVDTSKKGIYEVVYEITDNESTEIKTSKVEVTSNYIYASDIKEVSSKVEYRNLEKDKNPLGEQISLIRQGIVSSYKKGLGAHANSEVVYNIEDNNIDYFESYIGIDQPVSGSKSSATFEVWADGTKIYESGVFKDNTEHEFIKVPVTGAKEVKLITTDAKDGNGSDHTVWADAKFTSNSSKPEINMPNSISTKVGEVIDLGIYSAYDMEDGDLTDSVIVEGTVDFNKSGEYTLTYKVKDSDNNETIKTRTIAVVDMKDYNYLTNYDWKSANNSYGKAQKDKSASNNTLRLTNEEGIEVAYERGIGTHANSTIIYDLSDKNYDYFTSYVGVDRAMFGTVGSVTFQVLVDNVVKFDSGLMNSRDKQKYIEVDINGAKELKLIVTDGGNGNGSDHATWGDSKLHSAKSNSMPIIEVPNNVSIKLNEEYNLMEGVQATDEEDGDITTNVVVDKGDFTTSKAGEYIIKYTITDSVGNSTSKELTIIVYSDEKYISDVEWQSTTTTFKDVKKDTALGGGKIKLNVEGKETIFKKGLGTHANAEIVYDVENMDYEYFETYVGIDRNIKEQSKSSVIFKIFADDVEVYNSGIMKWSDDAKFARVSLKGVSKLTLVANDSGNGNESDHSLFANSRFLTTVEINRSNLDALLKEVDELEESNYIAETWNNLMTVKEKVNVSLSDGYNQKEIDSLYEELKIAKDNLKVVANYDSLIALVESTKELKDYIYTKQSWSILLESITNAETMIADKNTTIEEVNLMIEELTTSINNLEVRSDKVELEKLLNFADTITDISFVGASKHQEARWNNFVANRDIARKSLTDVDITVDQGNKIVFELQYFIDELQMK